MAWWNPFSDDSVAPGSPVDYACCLDWVSPLLAAIRDVAQSGHGIAVNLDACPSYGGVKKLMRDSGIDAWGYSYVPGKHYWIFSVAPQQADRAIALLRQNGVVIEYA